MAQAPAPHVDSETTDEPITPPSTKQRTALSDSACRHSIFYYEDDQRKHQVCCHCGRRRRIKIEKDGAATVGRWVLPRKKKEKPDG